MTRPAALALLTLFALLASPGALAQDLASGARGSAEAVAEAGGTPALAHAVAAALTEEGTLTASDAADDDNLGWSVALDGDRALVGAPFRECAAGANCGAAYVFDFDGTTWTQEAKLTASDAAASDVFGWSVALDGDRALIGAFNESSSGAAYVYDFDGTTWTQEAKLTASDAAPFDDFGYSVSLDGDRVLIGAHAVDCAAGSNCGAAYVFDFDGTTWTQEAKLTASDAAASDVFGFSVSLDGDRALIGAYTESSSGAAYVFDFDGTTWTQEAKLTASDAAASDVFGFSVSLDGNRALIGAYVVDCAAGVDCGAAYVFDFDGTTWTQEAKLTASDAAASDVFGFSVSLDGDRALIGAVGVDCAAGSNCGAAYVFDFDGTSWTEATILRASNAESEDIFGWSVSLDGGRAFVGATGVDCAAGVDCGAAYVFSLAPGLPDVDIAYTSSTTQPQRNDYVFIRARATNHEPTTVRTRVYFEVLYPSGATRRYSVLSTDFPATSSYQVQKLKPMKFPLAADAPAGTYTVTLYAADDIAAGGAVYDQDSFSFDLGPLDPFKTASGAEAGPNPFRESTVIHYALDADADVDLRVVDARGREVAHLASGVQTAGEHRAVFEAGALPGGVYVWRLSAGGAVTTGTVTLVR